MFIIKTESHGLKAQSSLKSESIQFVFLHVLNFCGNGNKYKHIDTVSKPQFVKYSQNRKRGHALTQAVQVESHFMLKCHFLVLLTVSLHVHKVAVCFIHKLLSKICRYESPNKDWL